MSQISTACLVGAALINLLPTAGVFSIDQLASAYGVVVAGPDLEILLRHRAVLLGIVGGLLFFAAFRPALRPLAGTVGLISMLSFILVLWIVGDSNASLGRVAVADGVALLLLAASVGIDRSLEVR